MTTVTQQQAREYVSANIRYQLQILCWTPADLAQRCAGAVPHNTVYRIVRGDNIGGIHHLKVIADVCGMTLDSLAKQPSGKILEQIA